MLQQWVTDVTYGNESSIWLDVIDEGRVCSDPLYIGCGCGGYNGRERWGRRRTTADEYRVWYELNITKYIYKRWSD